MKPMVGERAESRSRANTAVNLEVSDASSSCTTQKETAKKGTRLAAKAIRELKHELAQEVHDHTGQFIAALFLRLNMLDRHISSPEGRAVVEKMRCDLHQLGQECKRVALTGRPALLDHAGLSHAIAALLEHWAEVAGFAIEFRCNRPETRLEPAVELALYRVTQEALTNVVKHAVDTPKVSVTLQFDAVGWKYLKIEDRGPGFDLEDRDGANRDGKLGLVGMRRRLRSIGGSLDIISSRGFGTAILAWRQPPVAIRNRYHARPGPKAELPYPD
jgi:signal transduction histidine kinase